MPYSSYNNIKKCAAFVFMVFTVLSGASEVFDSDTIIKVGKKSFVDILAAGRFFAQDTRFSLSQSRIQSSMQNNEGLREFLDANAEDTSLNHIQACIFPLAIFIYYFNNIILKNNIWKNAVF